MVRRGSTVRVRQRASQKASKWPFLLPRRRTYIARASLNLSPKPVPNIAGALRSWLKQRRLTSSSTSVKRRCSNGTGRPEEPQRTIAHDATPQPRCQGIPTEAREPDQGSHRRESHEPRESFV